MARDKGVVFLLRHALAPGMGDQKTLMSKTARRRDCCHERTGRVQASMIGDKFRRNGFKYALVKSSQWCRCKETAELLKLGPVEEMDFLNSFLETPEDEKGQTALLREWLFKQTATREAGFGYTSSKYHCINRSCAIVRGVSGDKTQKAFHYRGSWEHQYKVLRKMTKRTEVFIFLLFN